MLCIYTYMRWSEFRSQQIEYTLYSPTSVLPLLHFYFIFFLYVRSFFVRLFGFIGFYVLPQILLLLLRLHGPLHSITNKTRRRRSCEHMCAGAGGAPSLIAVRARWTEVLWPREQMRIYWNKSEFIAGKRSKSIEFYGRFCEWMSSCEKRPAEFEIYK